MENQHGPPLMGFYCGLDRVGIEGEGGGPLALVLGTHCKTNSRSCGCRLEKRGLSQTQELSEAGLSEGHFLLGL